MGLTSSRSTANITCRANSRSRSAFHSTTVSISIRNDLGLLAIVKDDRVVGYNVLVGGGLGVTPSAKKTFPALAKRMAFCTPEQALDVVTAVVKVQRDFGNREDRKVARLKYLIANWGIEKFKAKVEEYYGAALPPPTDDDVYELQRPYGLGRARGRALVLRAEHRERPHQGR